MIYNPPTTTSPNKTSYQITFRRYKIGSKKEVKKAPVDKHAKVTETLETLMALKKVSQCKAMTNPRSKNPKIVFLGTTKFVFL